MFLSSTKQTQKDIDIALDKIICTDIQPLQIVDNKGFINFVRTINFDYIITDRKTNHFCVAHTQHTLNLVVTGIHQVTKFIHRTQGAILLCSVIFCSKKNLMIDKSYQNFFLPLNRNT